ncbi:16S rRNA (cytosine(1407)-C(5))-methyltransferase RsmF [Pseudoalteromonas peptidolytica]|uniref:16S rRNA (cytosine(1407)-C(5))-methyltransferase RsmF n=1 Tax=Pseudoalteromonas peptidolytica TaxID=61150 RepID=UPI00298E570E|nr:16S rRNA (cytosine(1407)-C(5))-methyltransferase RsmF [Pseudoalteromonas peptidolytica]MDW7548297.1 16S rRNA (cytosine(1407)-C(5))-methyltransferase RsmF [Pseudoalteromonas peptidolytica]
MDKTTYIPNDFIDDVKTYLPAHLSIDDFIATCQSPLRRAIRVNTLKMSITEFLQYCRENDWHAQPIPWCEEGFWITRSDIEEAKLAIGNTDIHLSGCIYVQEASSMLPPTALKTTITDNDINLDMASAPGSKTSQLAAYMGGHGVLVANELSSSRLKALAANMKRMGIHNVALSHFDGCIFGDYMYECFDNILLDAPCSGEGTVRKDPNALKNWSIESNVEIAAVQKQLIDSAFQALKPGGSLVYSTCTLTPLENQQVCQYLVDSYPDAVSIESLATLFEGAEDAVTPEGYLHVWPQVYDSEGFFIAKFTKIMSVPAKDPKQKKGVFPFNPVDKKTAQTFSSVLKKQFGISELQGTLMARDKEVWLFPNGFDAIQARIKYARIGVLVGTTHKNGIRLEHEFATAFGHLATQNILELTKTQARDYFNGKDIRLDTTTTLTGEVVLMLCGSAIGLGKWQKNKVKNSLPRDLIKDDLLITWV